MSTVQKGSPLRPIEDEAVEVEGRRPRKASRAARDEKAGGRNQTGTEGRSSSADPPEVAATMKVARDLRTKTFDCRRGQHPLLSIQQLISTYWR